MMLTELSAMGLLTTWVKTLYTVLRKFFCSISPENEKGAEDERKKWRSAARYTIMMTVRDVLVHCTTAG